MSYFSVERDNQCWENVGMKDDNGNEIEMWERYRNMTYNDMKLSEDLPDFVTDVMCAVNDISDTPDAQTIITLIGDDNIFIWSIIMGPGENGIIRYVLVDWKKDGKNYRYTP